MAGASWASSTAAQDAETATWNQDAPGSSRPSDQGSKVVV